MEGIASYILDHDGNPVSEPDLMTWAKWMSTNDCGIERSAVGGVVIATVFLGVDHDGIAALPKVFGTMVFGGWFDRQETRYRTRQRAIRGHAKRVEEVTASQTLTMVRIDDYGMAQQHGTPFALCSPAFEQWAGDHLRGTVRVFNIGDAFVGFTLKTDAAIFMLSPWYVPPCDGEN